MKAVVIGADVEARACAAALAKGGWEVVVVGETTPTLSLPLKGREPKSLRGHSNVWASTVRRDGKHLDFTSDITQTAAAIRAISAHDAEQWPRFCAHMHALAGVLEHLYRSPPPDPLTHETSGLIDLARVALRLRRLGRTDMTAFLRLLPMSAADLLNAWFESDAVKGVLGVAGVRDLAQGPRSGGTAFNLLHQHVGCAPGVFRRSQPQPQIELPASVQRAESAVTRIEVASGAVTGVVLDSGETIAADVVVSALDVKRTLLDLIDVGCLDPELTRAIRNIRSRGVTALVEYELSAAPDLATATIAPSLDYIERAYDHSKYGRVSAEPVIEAFFDGAQHAIAHVQYVPYALREGVWDEARRQALADLVARRIDAALPGFAGGISGSNVLTPVDLQARYGWPQGQRHHAEIALDQILWMRPVPALARYRTPVKGLYLCGAGMHPGGAIPGAAGEHAAAAVVNKK